METLTVMLDTVTPLWTGGVSGEADRVHSTGILGSLRWWYEVLVRGVGGEACDPSNHTCQYNRERPNDGLCDVCRMFGATGWKRRFRLSIVDNTQSGGPRNAIQPTGNRYAEGSTTDRPKWFFKGGRIKRYSLSVVPLCGAPDVDTIIHGILKLVENHAALGAKPQLGYGLMRVGNDHALNVQDFVDKLPTATRATSPEHNGKPSLTEMFFAELTPKADNKGNAVQTVLNLKYDLRKAFRLNLPGLTDTDQTTLRHFICGKEKPDDHRQASKVAISQLVDRKMRIWGWVPHALPVEGINRDDVMNIIHCTLSDFGTRRHWREFQSVRDWPHITFDAKQYLESLL